MNRQVCRNSKNYALTEGREYTTQVDVDNNDYLFVTNDNGIRARYCYSLFSPIEEEVEEEVEEPIQATTLEEFIRDLTFENNNGSLIGSFRLDGEDMELRVDASNNGRLTISCGIGSINNINSLMDIDIFRCIADREGFYEAFIEAAIGYLTSRSMTLLSTNITGMDSDLETLCDRFFRKLDDLCSTSATSYNDNSENNIKLWVLVNEEEGEL